MSAAHLKATLAHLTEAVLITDAAGRAVTFNDAFVRFHRLRGPDEVETSLDLHLVNFEASTTTGDPLPRERWAVPRALRGEVATDVEVRMRRRDTGESWIGSYSFAPIRDARGEIDGAVVVGRDITEQVRLERELLDSRERLAAIVGAAMDGIIAVDADERVVEFNAAAEAIFGWPRAEALGAPVASFIPARFRAHHAELMRRFAEAGGAVQRMNASGEVVGLRRNGEEFPVEATVSHLHLPNGRLSVVVLRDVTEQARAGAALQRAREELRALSALGTSAREQEKRRVARELHDEVTQTLGAMKISLDRAGQRVGERDTALRAELRALSEMAGGVITATRRIAADLRPSLLDDLGLAQALDWLAERYTARSGGRPCELVVDPPNLELPEPYASAVFRVVQEALTNVAKHAAASAVHVSVRRDGADLSVTVRDDGRGFSVDTPRRPESLGLAGLRERVYLLDGAVDIDSSPGRGTTVAVVIPLRGSPVTAAPTRDDGAAR